jgi:glutamate-1-semialdehyde 2,1-aminomutase
MERRSATPSDEDAADRFAESRRLTKLARRLIPGGAHTYARGEDQYPEDAPSFFTRGQGCRIWDADGNEFIEYGMGNRAVTLGYCHPAVNEAAKRQIDLGGNYLRPARIECEMAEKFLSLLPHKDWMVKFAKHGSDATSGGVKLARAFTGRDKIAICADHPFFSVDDWFIGSTVLNAGIPQAVRDLTVKFRYNNIESLKALFAEHPGQIALVVLEPFAGDPPAPGFLQAVIETAHAEGALVMFDEIITGFRLGFPAVHLSLGVTPDLASFSKALGNGFSISALVGRGDVMRLGGLDHDQPRVFLMSTTFGGEPWSMAAAMAVIDEYQRRDVPAAIAAQGARLRRGVERAIADAGVAGKFELAGHDANLVFVTKDAAGERSQAFRTIFMEQLIAGGVVGPSFVISAAHDDAAVDRTVEVVADALKIYARALEDGPEKHMRGRSVQPVWRRIP